MTWERILKNCRKYDCYPTIETFFSTCPPLIRNYLTLQTIPAGQLLIQAGAPCGTVYILVSGRPLRKRQAGFPIVSLTCHPLILWVTMNSFQKMRKAM